MLLLRAAGQHQPAVYSISVKIVYSIFDAYMRITVGLFITCYATACAPVARFTKLNCFIAADLNAKKNVKTYLGKRTQRKYRFPIVWPSVFQQTGLFTPCSRALPSRHARQGICFHAVCQELKNCRLTYLSSTDRKLRGIIFSIPQLRISVEIFE